MKPLLFKKLPMPLTKSHIIIFIISLVALGSIIAGIYVYTSALHQEKLPIIVTPEEEEQRQDETAYILEQENIRIDEYNFNELEKAKPILEKLPQDNKKIFPLKKFNELYNINIQPTKNCYYISNDNGDYPYIFGFKLESKKYKEQYGTEYYAYPKYDLPVDYFCGGSQNCEDDLTLVAFESKISNPCGRYWDN